MNRVRVQVTPNKDGFCTAEDVRITAIDAKLGHQVGIDNCSRIMWESYFDKAQGRSMSIVRMELIMCEVDIEMPEAQLVLVAPDKAEPSAVESELTRALADGVELHEKLVAERRKVDEANQRTAEAGDREAVALAKVNELELKLIEATARLAEATKPIELETTPDTPGLGGPTDVTHSTGSKRRRQ